MDYYVGWASISDQEFEGQVVVPAASNLNTAAWQNELDLMYAFTPCGDVREHVRLGNCPHHATLLFNLVGQIVQAEVYSISV